jgi:hypothetical protein
LQIISKIVVTSVLALTLAACDGTWETDNVKKPTTAAEVTTQKAEVEAVANKTPDQITLHSGAIAGKNYSVIQKINVTVNKTTAFHPAPTVEAVQQKLREAAAELGADAVASVKISDVKVSAFSWGTRKGEGEAVKFD